MNIFTKLIAGQSLISWALQLIFIALAWMVVNHQVENNLMTIFGATILLLLCYASLARDGRQRHR
ncbi:hypothetical protein [Secundilactobacillus kimchicus]|uniref:Uncharacterized protein n=1 Tax=Secundilactobacillus kimchicus JCM 15530 TaxID=1302272 RepID=A0A0R1I0Q0_9LACO|nr:hypothetical protein [Secundilactobacillus kimchicus]KRK48855.1 hypothetical protein FC96_GL001176 [Secundilactobacillus kimchicus JCM 15530]